SWPIYSVIARQCGSQNQADHEGGSSTSLQVFRQDIRRIRPQVRAEIFKDFGLGKLEKGPGELFLCVPPCEVSVRLRETELGETIHHAWSRKRLGWKQGVGMTLLDFRDQPLPKGKCFRVRVVDPEDANAALDPEEDDASEFFPELAPAWCLKIQWVNILIFLRGIFSVLNRSVRPLTKPFGMRPDVGVIGRALQSDVQRDFDSVVGGPTE